MTRRLANNLNVSIPGLQAEELLAACPSLAFSSGSACSTDRMAPSHVLDAIGLSKAQVFSSLRFGLGRDTTSSDIAESARIILEAAEALIPARA